jgi:hypothetical protein
MRQRLTLSLRLFLVSVFALVTAASSASAHSNAAVSE